MLENIGLRIGNCGGGRAADASFRNTGPKKHGEESPNLYARTLVQRALSGSPEEELKGEVERLGSEMRKSRHDIATVALLLLVKICREDPQKAREWIRENLENA